MHLFYILLQVLKVLFINIYKTQLPALIFLMFYISFFASTDTIFHNYLEPHSTLSEKKIFNTKCPFLTDSLNPQPP